MVSHCNLLPSKPSLVWADTKAQSTVARKLLERGQEGGGMDGGLKLPYKETLSPGEGLAFHQFEKC
jgi:hypothetical protein